VSAEIVVIAPVLARPHNAHPVVRSLAASTKKARMVFACSPSDETQIAACKATGAETVVVPWEPDRGDWARKINYIRDRSEEPYILLGADDLRFHDGWDDEALLVFDQNDVGVVGTNDLANPRVRSGTHATHPMVCRGYADMYGTIDEPELLLHEGYWHQFVDNELVETAKARGCWAFANYSKVEHLHPAWNTAPDDATYQRGQEQGREDLMLFHERRRLWL
jgi:hypothetical protein